MEPDEEPESGSSSQSQNLHDLQNYLVTFNKDIGSGDDVLPNTSMDVDGGVGDDNDLYGAPSDHSLHESGDAGVSGQFSTGFYSEQGILDTTLSDESAHQIQNLVSAAGTDVDDSEVSEIKQEVGSMNLEGVTAQLAGFGDAHLSHTISGLQNSSLSQGLIMTPLGDSVMTNQGKVLSIMSLGGEDGQFLSLDGQQMQIINSEDLGLTTDGLDTDGSLDISSANSLIRSSGNADSPIPFASLSTSSGSGIALPVHSSVAGGSLITSTANTTATLLNSSLGQLVSLHGVGGEGGQPQLVSLQGDALHSDGLQMPGLLGADGLNSDLAYQTITIMPSELSQHGEMNYVLILSQPEGEKESMASVTQVYDLKQENQDFSEEIMDENGDTKRILRFVPKKMASHLGNQQLMCAFCNYTSPKRYLLTRHMRSHSDERPFKCESCERGFKTSASLLNHVNTHTGTRPHKCKTCEAAFTTSGELVRHIRYRHTFEKPHRCPECDYASVELSKLKRHMRSHTGERPYKCPNCPYASPDTYKLKRHMRIHTGEKPYECDHCHARFTQSNSLKAHKLIHTGNKPVYQCSLCPTTCGRKTDLKIHFNKLHSVAGLPLECRKCGKHFPDRYSYKQHLRSHDIEKCYKCEHCNFIAANEKSLDAHSVIHCAKHWCDECNTTFSNQKQFDKHVTLLHPNSQASRKLNALQKILNEGDENLISTVDTDPSQRSLALSLPTEQLAGDCGESSGSSQVIVTPLASGTLHKNLIQDIKEGKLGDVPQVVIVHPDGSQEEISSKLTSDRWTVENDFPTSTRASRAEHALSDRSPNMPVSLAGGSVAPRDARYVAASKEEEEGLSCHDGDSYSQVEPSQHCEASTQVEIESDAESSSDGAGLDCGPREKEMMGDSAHQFTKVLQDSVGSLFSLGTSAKTSLAVSNLTHALKTSTSSAPLYLKTLINKSSGKKSLTSFSSSSQTNSLQSVLKVTPAISRPQVASTGSSNTHQYSLLRCNTSTSAAGKARTSDLICDRTSSLPKMCVSSLSSLGDGNSSKPPIQLLSGDVNLTLPTECDQGGNDIHMLEDISGLQSSSSSSGLLQEDVDLQTDDSNTMERKEMKDSEENIISSCDTQQVTDTMHDDQRIEYSLSSLGDQGSTAAPNRSDQSAIQNFICRQLSLSSDNNAPTHSHILKEQVQSTGLELNMLSAIHENPSSYLDDGNNGDVESLLGQDSMSTMGVDVDSSLHSDDNPLHSDHSQQHVTAVDLDNQSVPQDNQSLTIPLKPCPSSLSSDQAIMSTDTITTNDSLTLVTKPVTSRPKNSNVTTLPSVCGVRQGSRSSRSRVNLLPPTVSYVSADSANSSLLDISNQSEQTLDQSAVESVNAEGSNSISKEPSLLKIKSTKGRMSAKQKAETDPSLVVTGKRQRKVLVKVSL